MTFLLKLTGKHSCREIECIWCLDHDYVVYSSGADGVICLVDNVGKVLNRYDHGIKSVNDISLYKGKQDQHHTLEIRPDKLKSR